jgi:hypothetical protein
VKELRKLKFCIESIYQLYLLLNLFLQFDVCNSEKQYMMYRHFDNTHLEEEFLVVANFGWFIDCTNINDFEKDIYFYHKDHFKFLCFK